MIAFELYFVTVHYYGYAVLHHRRGGGTLPNQVERRRRDPKVNSRQEFRNLMGWLLSERTELKPAAVSISESIPQYPAGTQAPNRRNHDLFARGDSRLLDVAEER